MPPKRLTPNGQAAPPPEPNVATTQSIKKKATKKTQKTSTPRTDRSGTKYIRNLRNIPARVTLDTKRRIELGPRGSVEDLAPVTKEEQNDAKFLANIGWIYEVITAAEARSIIEKQSTNAQAQRPNYLVELLRNEKGEEYDQGAVQMGPTPGSNDIIVGQVEDAADGRFTEHNKEIVRRDGPPQQVAVPGSIQNPLPEIPSDISAEEVREFIAWREARQTRESLNVTVEPVQREE